MSDCSMSAMKPKKRPGMCSCNRSRNFDALAQVAREMYAWCDGTINKAWTIVPERIDGFREKLEALGVSVDDR